MGCYAEAVRALHLGTPSEPPLPGQGGWVVLTTGVLSPRQARALFPSRRRLLVLGPGLAHAGARGVGYGRLEPGPRLRLSAGTLRDLDGTYTGAVLLDGLRETSGRLLLQLARRGVARVAWRDAAGWRTAPTRVLAFAKPFQRLLEVWQRTGCMAWYRARIQRGRAHQALKARNAQVFPGAGEWAAHLARVGIRPPVRRAQDGARRRLSVVLYIGQLNSGGAERQLCNLALALRRRGDAVRVLTTYPLTAENAHYLHLLRAGGVQASMAGMVARRGVVEKLAALDIRPDVLGALPEVLRHPVLDLCGELLADPPDVLHCWLDYPNIIGAAAGALAGAPHVVLSTRNVNPRHFPAFYQAWMDGWYAFLGALPQVHLVANSAQGADDYARWLGLPRERFTVIRNGVDLATLAPPPAAELARLRAELGAGDGRPLLLGVFRLAPEKQPELFLDVVARVREQLPALRVALAGVGPLQQQVEASIRARGLTATVALLGQRKDVPALLAAADALLLTSAVEGTPNVLLEAQWLRCPPVATAVGGTPDTLVDGATGFLNRPDDAAGLARSVLAILGDRARREELGRAGQAFVRERFALQRMLDDTLRHYEAMLGADARDAAPTAAPASGAPGASAPAPGAAPAAAPPERAPEAIAP